MKVLVQWATTTASDWVEYDITSISQVRAMPKKPVPSDSSVIDNQPGWLSAINIQGVVLSGDHIGFSIDGLGRLVVGVWNDDVDDWFGVPFGWVYTFDSLAPDPTLPVSERPDAELYMTRYPERIGLVNGIPCEINTRQTVTRYADDSTLQALVAGGDIWAQAWFDDPNRKVWSEFPRFTNNNTIHGVWLDPMQHDSHVSIRSSHGWREWGA